MMKKAVLGAVLIGFTWLLYSQDIQHEAVAVNIEVPVRVFKSGVFVDTLTIDDFEVYEDGVNQKIEAVYLIRKAEITRREEKEKTFQPRVSSRHFVLYFETVEYLPKVGEALDYFFAEVLQPGDSLFVVTPAKTYTFDSRALTRMTKQKIADQLKEKVREDSWKSNREYRNLLREYESIGRTELPGDLKLLMQMEIVRQIKHHKFFDDEKAQEFAAFLKEREGQKHVFFFYQKEMFPVPPGASGFDRLELMSTDAPDTLRLQQVFADSSISCHFLYVNKAPANVSGTRQRFGDDWMDMTVGTFQGMMEVAKATGGLTESSANAAAAFKKAAEASENYYLIYYSPKDYRPDGRFRKIRIRVKGGRYRILHRAGYLAD
jgi:VWFA-related protein